MCVVIFFYFLLRDYGPWSIQTLYFYEEWRIYRSTVHSKCCTRCAFSKLMISELFLLYWNLYIDIFSVFWESQDVCKTYISKLYVSSEQVNTVALVTLSFWVNLWIIHSTDSFRSCSLNRFIWKYWFIQEQKKWVSHLNHSLNHS